MGVRVGSGYLGSSKIETSVANQEIVPTKENGKPYVFKKFAFYNENQTTIKINGGNPIILIANQGFTCDITDAPIYSFVVVNGSVKYNWIGMY